MKRNNESVKCYNRTDYFKLHIFTNIKICRNYLKVDIKCKNQCNNAIKFAIVLFIIPQHIPNENRRQKWNLPRQIWTVKFVWSNIEHTYIHTYIVMLTLRKRFPSNNAFLWILHWIEFRVIRLDFHISLTFTLYVNYYI